MGGFETRPYEVGRIMRNKANEPGLAGQSHSMGK